ncbi:Arginine--tRNA ligase [Candidatus Gugararchaeum adminiculabundum]|nr:Arginine--tRNA ligase [Candidatus Gugararchaeum adminiculabundum]
MPMYSEAKGEIAKIIAKAAGVSEQEAANSLELPKNEFGDLASTIAFALAKKEKKSPIIIAREIAGKIKPSGFVEKVEATGPYLNFFFSGKFFSELIAAAEKKEFGKGNEKKKKVLVEFPSVNPNKPWHVGHLRNAVLGDSLSRILEFYGFEVERENYIDDLGLQVAQSVWGYLHLDSKIEGKADHWLGKQYVEVAKKIGEDKKVEGETREIVKKLEEGGNEVARKGRELCSQCLKAQNETAFDYNVYSDILVWESDVIRTIYKTGMGMLGCCESIVKETSGKNAGCLVAKLSNLPEFAGMENPDKILVRSDGTATYTGKDVIFQMWKLGIIDSKFKYEEFGGKLAKGGAGKLYTTTNSTKGKTMKFGSAAIAVNVIGVEQSYPQQAIASILKLMGYEKQSKNCVHLAYEHVTLEGERFSGRAGTWVGFTADELLEQGKKESKEKIKIEVSEKEKNEIAKSVAIAAIRFSFSRTSPEKKIVFKWEEALNFEGDSGPYVQYAHARCASILRKMEGKVSTKIDGSLMDSKDERKLMKHIAEFGEAVRASSENYRPHLIADYALVLAGLFNKFYATSRVLQEEDVKIRDARIALVLSTKNVLAQSLGLLGINAPEKM